MADIRIKDIEQVAAIKDTMKVPVGNAGDDKSYTATFKQIRDYTKQDLTGYVTNTQLDSRGYTTMQDVENKGYITMDNVGNGALTLNVNGVKKTFTANQSEDLTIEINSFKPNNGRLILKIKDKEYIFTADQEKDITVDIPAGEGSADWSEITNKPTFAAVATSGSYADLSSKPTIPSKVSQLTNDSGYIQGSEVDKKFIAKSTGADTNIVVATNGSMANYGNNGQSYMAVRPNTGEFTIDAEYGGSAFGVKDDGTTAFTHKSFAGFDKDKGTGTGTKNTAVLQFSGNSGLRYAKNTGTAADVTADMYKYVGIIGSPDENQNVYSAKEVDNMLSGIPKQTETLIFTTKDGQTVEYNFYIKTN